MFSSFNNLPLHPLAVHAAVVLVPLAAVLGICFAIPRTRAWARLPMVIVSIAAMASVFVSKESGEPLEEKLNLQGKAHDLIEQHSERADQLFVMTIVFAGLAVVAYLMTRVTSRPSKTVTNVLAALLVVGSIGVAVQTFRVGDVGARAVWNPSGNVNFSNSGEAGGSHDGN